MLFLYILSIYKCVCLIDSAPGDAAVKCVCLIDCSWRCHHEMMNIFEKVLASGRFWIQFGGEWLHLKKGGGGGGGRNGRGCQK